MPSWQTCILHKYRLRAPLLIAPKLFALWKQDFSRSLQKHKPQNHKQLKAASLSRRLIGLHWKRAGFRTLDVIQTHHYLDQPHVVDTPTMTNLQIHVHAASHAAIIIIAACTCICKDLAIIRHRWSIDDVWLIKLVMCLRCVPLTLSTILSLYFPLVVGGKFLSHVPLL